MSAKRILVKGSDIIKDDLMIIRNITTKKNRVLRLYGIVIKTEDAENKIRCFFDSYNHIENEGDITDISLIEGLENPFPITFFKDSEYFVTRLK